MACLTTDPVGLGVVFNAPKGKSIKLLVKALGTAPPPTTVVFASYGGNDITSTLGFTALAATHALIIVPLCPVDGQMCGLFEDCPAAGPRLLKRFRFTAADPRRIFVVEGV